jgi:phosphatidylserine/phosphatidylglycerophosphate/cardiolipin synthase-like enzyme
MKRFLPIFLLLFACLVPGCQAQQDTSQATSLPPIEVFFSPKGGCTEAVVKELNAAKETVLVQAYSFTSTPIAKALLAAHKRGVKVQVILDKSQKTEKYSDADFLVNVGIPVQIDAKHAIAHNKVIVIDGATVITGSFNFTKAAEEHNAENLLVIRSPELAAKYAANWKAHADHSDPYAGRTEGYSQTHRAESAAPATTPVTEGYVASRNSQVFHKAGCKSAAKISEKNLVRYNTRDEAIQAGKKPCHECNP